MIRAVLDTSSLYANGTRRQLQAVAATGLYTALWSPWIVAELNRVLTWRWIRRRPDGLSPASERACSEAASAMMAALLPTFEVVAPRPPYPPAWDTFSDPHDYPVWAAAVEGRAAYVVSENTRHYPPRGRDGHHMFEGVTYLPAASFLTLLLGDEWAPG